MGIFLLGLLLDSEGRPLHRSSSASSHSDSSETFEKSSSLGWNSGFLSSAVAGPLSLGMGLLYLAGAADL